MSFIHKIILPDVIYKMILLKPDSLPCRDDDVSNAATEIISTYLN